MTRSHLKYRATSIRLLLREFIARLCLSYVFNSHIHEHGYPYKWYINIHLQTLVQTIHNSCISIRHHSFKHNIHRHQGWEHYVGGRIFHVSLFVLHSIIFLVSKRFSSMEILKQVPSFILQRHLIPLFNNHWQLKEMVCTALGQYRILAVLLRIHLSLQ